MSDVIPFLKKVDELIRAIDGVPYRFRDPVDPWISERNRWIMYAAPELETKEQAVSAPLPNVWVGESGEDGSRVGFGISYQTKPLVETFLQLDALPNRQTREKILAILANVSERWEFVVYQKTRWDTFASSPGYDERERVPCREVDGPRLTSLLEHLRRIHRESHDRDTWVKGRRIDYQGAAFDLMYASAPFPSAEFGVCAREIFGVFEQCLLLKDPPTIRRELETMRDDIRLLQMKLVEAERMIHRKDLPPQSRARAMQKAEAYRQALASYPAELRNAAATEARPGLAGA